jgi:hypothetical protein
MDFFQRRSWARAATTTSWAIFIPAEIDCNRQYKAIKK